MPIYYNRFDRAKQYKDLAFVGGRDLQSAEMNDLQSFIFDEMSQLAKLIITDGQIINEMGLVLSGTTARVTDGTIYYANYFHKFTSQTITVTNTGIEKIGILFTKTYVTSATDSGLLDPATEEPNFGQSGADRVKYVLTLVLNNANAITIYTLQDGIPNDTSTSNNILDEIFPILARRTNDESASYMVYGYDTTVEANSSSQYNLVVNAGKAYVLGWETILPAAKRIAIDRPITYSQITDEPHTYLTGTDLYALAVTPAQSITSISAVVTKTDVDIVRGGSAGGSDVLPFTPVASVISVTQGATTYVVTTDYVVSGNNISWAPGGAEPATGSTYQVTFNYIKQLQPTTDFVLTNEQADLSPASEVPDNNSVMYITYNAYLNRKDLLTLDVDGVFHIIKGQPAFAAEYPSKPNNQLLINFIELPANGGTTDIVVVNSGIYRLTMEDLRVLVRRVSDLEYNTAVSALEQSAFNLELASDKKAIFVDNFFDQEKADIGHGLFSCSIDTFGHLYPGFAFVYHDLTGYTGERFLLNYSHVSLINQPFASDAINVNYYDVPTFSNYGGALKLTPADDIAVANDTITIDKRVRTLYGRILKRYIPADQLQAFYQRIRDYKAETHGIRPKPIFVVSQEETTSETIVLGTSRSLSVTIEGSYFIPNTDNLALTFDGTAVNMTAVAPTVAGTNAGTIKADANGYFKATFTVPSGLIGGTKSVVVNNATNEANAQFVIGQINRTTIVNRKVYYRDPIARSFKVEEACFVSKVDLAFKTKDATKSVLVTIQDVVNGLPGIDVYARAVVLPANITTSNNGSSLTTVTFDSPAYCDPTKEYCIVVATASSQYSLFIGKYGSTDLATGFAVARNANAGVLFTSSNGSTWIADQTADLKFTLYRADFTTPRVLTFDQLSVDGSVFNLLVDQETPQGTGVAWEYSTDSGASWNPVVPDTDIDTVQIMTTLDLRATLTGTAKLSPIIGSAGKAIVTKWDATGNYISRNTTNVPTYTDIDVYIDLDLPSGSSITAYYSTDGGTNWTTLGSATLSQVIDSTYTEYHYHVGSLSATQMKIRVLLTCNGSRTTRPSIQRLRAIAS